MGFAYEDDTVSYDIDKALPFIQNTLSNDIDAIIKALNELVEDLNQLQSNAVDKPGTAVTEDYKDMEHLIGSAFDKTGINGFSKSVHELLDNMFSTLEEWKRITSK